MKLTQKSSGTNKTISQCDNDTQENLNSNLTKLSSKYQIIAKIGEGSFGVLYKISSKIDQTQELAVKFALKSKQQINSLKKEATFLQALKGISGFPKFYEYNEEGQLDYLIIQRQLLGLNLQQLLLKCGGSFSLKTVLMIGIQLISLIHNFHQLGYVYQDFKPENILIGNYSEQNKIYLIDFGLSKYYLTKERKHIPLKWTSSAVGTLRYCSVSCQQFIEQSRRDDLESIMYLLIYLAKGSLPWQQLKCPKSELQQEILKIKTKVWNTTLCQGLPEQFQKILTDLKHLKFDEQPKYDLYSQYLLDILNENHWINDNIFDWDKLMKPKNYFNQKLLKQESYQQNSQNLSLTFEQLENDIRVSLNTWQLKDIISNDSANFTSTAFQNEEYFISEDFGPNIQALEFKTPVLLKNSNLLEESEIVDDHEISLFNKFLKYRDSETKFKNNFKEQ